MNLRQLEIFHAIMRASSLTEAARNLNISQPAVSSMLKHTESQLGMKLFQRHGGRLHPTPEAQLLYADVASIFARVKTLNRMVQTLRDGQSGLLSVAASPTLANALLPAVVASFRQERPQVRLLIHSLQTQHVIDQVANREVDLGIVYKPSRPTPTDFEAIGSARVMCVLHVGHPLARCARIQPADLAGQPLLTYGPATPFGSLVSNAFRAARVPFDIAVEVTYSLTGFVLAAAGAGIALVDALLPFAGELPDVVIRPFSPKIEVPLEVHYARDRPRSRLAEQFVQQLRRLSPEIAARTAQPSASARRRPR